MMVKPYPTYSVIQEMPVPSAGAQRATRGANPVGANVTSQKDALRAATISMTPNATPRQKHPKLNAEPWSISYAQSRSQPKTAGAIAKKNRTKRRMTQKQRG